MFSDPVPCGSASIFSFAGPLRYVSGIFERNSTMANGTVKWFNSNKGFGFIAPEAGSKDVFIHISALERAGIRIETACRSGACGFCRTKVLSGSVYICPENDGRRAADKDFGYVHACAAYPTSDLTIKIPIA